MVKARIELSDGRAMLSSVLTDGKSDWATGPYEHPAQDFWMRATVAQGIQRLQVSADGKTWPLVRRAPFAIASSYQVGPMACPPERNGRKSGSQTSESPPARQRPARSALSMLTAKQNLLRGDLYAADDPELAAGAAAASVWLARYNAAFAAPPSERTAMLAEAPGHVGDGATVRSPLHFDYGYNFHLEDGVFLNFGCIVLDVVSVRERRSDRVSRPSRRITPAIQQSVRRYWSSAARS